MTRILLLGETPHDERALLVPTHRVLYEVEPGTTLRQIGDLPALLGGMAIKPDAPLVIRTPDGIPVLIPGFGVTEAAELQDLAYGVYEKHQQRLKERRGGLIDRERHGLVARERFSDAFKQALADRMERHRRNPVSDPARQPYYPERRRLY